MERHKPGKEALRVPTDFTSPTLSRNVQDLVPPSHFASVMQSAGAHRGVHITGTPPPNSWINPTGPPGQPGDPIPANPWRAITQAQQEILELRKENQRIMMLHKNSIEGRIPADHPSDLRARPAERSEQGSRWESEWRLEAEKHKAEAERLKGKVEALRESAGRHREEMRDRDSTLNRQSLELEAMREELCTAKTELSRIRDTLSHSGAQKEIISSQLEKLNKESGEEIARLRRDIERRREEARELALTAETARLQAEEKAKQQTLCLSQQLKEMQKMQEMELQKLNASHAAELDAASKMNCELQDRLQSMTSDVLQLKSTLMEVSTERDGLKEHLSQMGHAFETQSATLQSLRNYIGQLAPEKREKEQLNEAVERLNKEKAALQMTTELLTIRLNSVNEILTLQDETMAKQTSADPHAKNKSKDLQVMRLWREKVFKLCVQLRSKDIELRGEKDKLLSEIGSLEQQLQQEQCRAGVLQHSLDDRIAELDLERVEKETLKYDLAQAHKENSRLKSESQRSEAERQVLTEAVHRFRLAFESKVAEVDAAQTRLHTFTQRLIFATRRVDTIQGLTMRKVALQKIQQAGSKQAEEAADSLTNLQTELGVVSEERDELAQELKRTPELIERALADLKEQYEGKQKQQQQELAESWAEAWQAVAEREKAEQSLRHIQAQLEESKVSLEKLSSELLAQQEHSEQVLQEKVSEIEGHCAEKLKEMEHQLNTARREHTKAVMTLRQFERQARELDEARRTRRFGDAHTKREVHNTRPRKTERDKQQLPATVAEQGLMSEYTRRHPAASHKPAALREQQQLPSEKSSCVWPKAQPSAEERLLSVLGELECLSAAVVHSSEDSAEEEGEINSVGPSTDR